MWTGLDKVNFLIISIIHAKILIIKIFIRLINLLIEYLKKKKNPKKKENHQKILKVTKCLNV